MDGWDGRRVPGTAEKERRRLLHHICWWQGGRICPVPASVWLRWRNRNQSIQNSASAEFFSCKTGQSLLKCVHNFRSQHNFFHIFKEWKTTTRGMKTVCAYTAYIENPVSVVYLWTGKGMKRDAPRFPRRRDLNRPGMTDRLTTFSIYLKNEK